MTIRDGNDRLQQAGMAWEPSQQGHHWFRDGLLYQAGGESLSEDRRTILLKKKAMKPVYMEGGNRYTFI